MRSLFSLRRNKKAARALCFYGSKVRDSGAVSLMKREIGSEKREMFLRKQNSVSKEA